MKVLQPAACLVFFLCPGGHLLAADTSDAPYESPIFEHPVFEYDLSKANRKAIAKDRLDIMSMTEAQIRAAVPRQTGLMNVGCPNWECTSGRKWNQKGQLPHSYGWKFDPRQPDKMQCPDCKEVYPDNPKYPMTKSITILNPAQEKVTLPYWEDTKHDRKRTKFFLRGMLNAARWDWYQSRMVMCSQGYLLTGDEDYAYKASILLDAMCDVFPHWVMCDDYGDGYRSYPTGTRPDQDDTRIGRRGGAESFGGSSMRMVYDVCYDSEGLRRVSRQTGKDLRTKFVRNVVKFTNPNLFDGRPLQPAKWTQACPGSEYIISGKLLHEPRLLRFFIECQERAPFKIHGSDGAFFQGPGYASIHLIKIMNMRNLNGYSDPPNYPIPEGEERYTNWQFPSGHYERFYKNVFGIWRDICRPDGNAIVFNDAGGGYTSATFIDTSPRKSSVNVMKHGLKHVVLGDGEGNDQVQAHMGFGEGGKHMHTDTLGLQLYAFGHYLLDDITYPKHRLRREYSSSQFHNTVSVDEQDQVPHLADGDPLLYEPQIPGVAAVRVDAARAFPGVTERYERTIVNVTTDINKPYVVDVFRVKGGDVHDYMLLSSYKWPSTAKSSLNLRKLPGTRPLMPKGAKWEEPNGRGLKYPYGIFTNVRAAEADNDFTLTYEVKEPWTKRALYQHPDKPRVGTKHHFIGSPNQRAMLADIPRRADGKKPIIELEQMPHFILRSDSDGEESVFIAIHEPFMDEPVIRRVKRLPSKDGTVALEVTLPDRVDRVVLSFDEDASYEANGLETDGRVAIVSQPSKGEPFGAIIGGTILTDTASGIALEQETDRYQGEVRQSSRMWDGQPVDGFDVTGSDLPPAGDDLHGAWIVLRNRGVMNKIPTGLCPTDYNEWRRKYYDPDGSQARDKRRVEATPHTGGGWAFEIDRVEVRDGRTFVLTKQDHGLKIEGEACQELFYPHRKMTGDATDWWINTAASTKPLKDLREKQIVHEVDHSAAPASLKPGLQYSANKSEVKVLTEIDFQPFLHTLALHRVHNFKGYLKVPEDGVYTFHYRPGSDGSLMLGGKTIIERTGRIGSPMARVAHVKLKKGLVPIDFVIDTTRLNKYWKTSSDFEWEGPGLDRRPIAPSDFLHVP